MVILLERMKLFLLLILMWDIWIVSNISGSNDDLAIGTTTADALCMFIYAFNDHHGFPYPVQSRRMQVEPFDTEEEATEFATDIALEMIK